MHIIDHRQFAEKSLHKGRRPWVRWTGYGVTALVGVFVLANIGMAIAYHGRVLPNYRLGQADVSGKQLTALNAQVLSDQLLPATMAATTHGKTARFAPRELGVQVDAAASVQALKKSRNWLPVFCLVTHHTVAPALTINDKQYMVAIDGVNSHLLQAALPTRPIYRDGTFSAAPPADGYGLDPGKFKQALLAAASQGKQSLVAPTVVTAAPAASDITAAVAKMNRFLSAAPAYVHQGKTTKPSGEDIAQWFVENSTSLASDHIATYLDTITPNAANRHDLILATMYAYDTTQAYKFSMVPAGSRVRTYCTAARGVDLPPNGAFTGTIGSSYTTFVGKLAATYADTRGWNDGGRIAFEHTAGGCEYTVWLSAASQMTSFSPICDDYYNCQAGTNVVVNNDRWEHATPSWNATGGSLENYRVLIINHETGHRLGFYDNNVCPGAGQPAPVMMQQSIDLVGCVFNIWPLTTELSALSVNLGLPVVAN